MTSPMNPYKQERNGINFTQILPEEVIPANSFCDNSITPVAKPDKVIIRKKYIPTNIPPGSQFRNL